jgi:hypothetical protein
MRPIRIWVDDTMLCEDIPLSKPLDLALATALKCFGTGCEVLWPAAGSEGCSQTVGAACEPIDSECGSDPQRVVTEGAPKATRVCASGCRGW